MSSQNRFTDEFKRDAVAQIVDRGYAVSEVAERLGVSTESLYTWKALFAKPATVREAQADLADALCRVKKELTRVTEERDIQKRPQHTSRESPGEVWLHPGSSIRVFGSFNVPCADGPRQRLLCMA